MSCRELTKSLHAESKSTEHPLQGWLHSSGKTASQGHEPEWSLSPERASMPDTSVPAVWTWHEHDEIRMSVRANALSIHMHMMSCFRYVLLIKV